MHRCMYAPMLRRRVYLVCFDVHHNVALVSGSDGLLRWSLPVLGRKERETYFQCADRLLASLSCLDAARTGLLVGCLEASWPLRGAGRREGRVFVAHVRTEDSSVVRMGGTARWVPYTQVGDELGHLAVLELPTFIKGYVEGWIPDGWITLS